MRDSTREKAAALATRLVEDYSVVTIDAMDKAYGATQRAYTQIQDAIVIVQGVDFGAQPPDAPVGIRSATLRLRQAAALVKKAMVDLIPDAEGSHDWRDSDIS